MFANVSSSALLLSSKGGPTIGARHVRNSHSSPPESVMTFILAASSLAMVIWAPEEGEGRPEGPTISRTRPKSSG